MGSSNRSFLRVLAAATAISFCRPLSAQSVFTYAGGGTIDGRPATTVALDGPSGITVDSAGNLYIAEKPRHQVRRVTVSSGIIETIAGSGSPGSSGDGGRAAAASLNQPNDVAVDAAGNVYVADEFNHRIRRIAPGGIITTYAGTTSFGPGGEGGPATATSLFVPSNVATDPFGNVFITENASRIRRVSPSGIITTVAGSTSSGFGGDGGPGTLGRLSRAEGIATDRIGNLYIADYGNGRIRKLDRASGIITTYAGNGGFGFAGDGGPATAATLHGPDDVWVDASGNVFIAEANGGRIRRVDAVTGIIMTVAGGTCCDRSDGISASQAYFEIDGVAVDSAGNIFIAEDRQDFDKVRKVDAVSSIVSTIAGVSSASSIFTGDGGPATGALLSLSGIGGTQIRGLALDAEGNLFIADKYASRIRRVDARTGFITTITAEGTANPGFTGLGALPGGLAVDRSGNVYVADTSYHKIRKIDAATGTISIYAGQSASSGGDGKPATQAGIGVVSGLAIDRFDNLYLTDGQSIRRIDAATKIITTIAGTPLGAGYAGDGGPATAAKFSSPRDLTVDAARNIYIADFGNNRVRKIDASGMISTVAGTGSAGSAGDGGPSTLAQLTFPSNVVADAAGNLYIADQGNDRIRKIDGRTSTITTYAGLSIPASLGSYSGDNGPASRATFVEPDGLAVTPAGDLFIADGPANRVRLIYSCVEIAAPQLVTPAEGSSGVTTSPKLSWKAVRGAFRYDVLLDTVNPPVKVAAEDVTTLSVSPANLDPLTTYYWQVIAKGDPFCTPPSKASSEVRSFTTASGCRRPAGFEGASP